MKKTLKIVLCAFLALLVVGGAVAWSFLPHPLNYRIGAIEPVGSDLAVVSESADEATVKKTGEGDLRVLLFTDLHLDGKNDTSLPTVTHLVENIQREKPDLVILNGDTVTSGLNGARAKQLGRIFEKLGVYWAGGLGNHEGDNPYSVKRQKMTEIFSSFPHCLMRMGPPEIDGCCNYALHVLNAADERVQTFYFLDTFDELDDEKKADVGWQEGDSEYDGAHENQIAWFVKKAAETQARYGGGPRGTAVMHIPLPQLAEAAEDGAFLFGEKREGVCCTGYETGLFAKMKASGAVQAAFFGHDHLNDFGLTVDGILLSYIQPGNYGSYNVGNRLGYEEKDWIQGFTRLTVHRDGTFTQEQILNSRLDG